MQSTLSTGRLCAVSDLLESGVRFLRSQQIDAPRLEAEHLLAARLGCDRLKLFLDAEKPVSEDCRKGFLQDISRRAAHEPLQYIVGEVEFYGMFFSVAKGVFIPRPETELIVEAALSLPKPPTKILDLCTGSGALAIALAASLPASTVIATELSDDALQIAKSNAKKNGCAAQISFLKGDLFEPLKKDGIDRRKFDLIVSNPPYISEADRKTLPPEVREHEPALALFAEDEGRVFYRRILFEAPSLLNDEGMILLELGHNQSEWLRQFFENEIRPSHKNLSLSFISDWAGIERIARITLHAMRLKEAANG